MTKNDRFIVIDTETTNSIDDPLCYDVGFAVVDMLGNVYENYSFVVADILNPLFIYLFDLKFIF